MRKLILCFLLLPLLFACNSSDSHSATTNATVKEKNADLDKLMEDYYKERMSLFPVEATWNGYAGNNDKLYPDFTDSYRAKLNDFYSRTLSSLQNINRERLDENDKISYDFLKEYTTMGKEELSYPTNRMPTDQMWGLHLVLGQFASGSSAQP